MANRNTDAIVAVQKAAIAGAKKLYHNEVNSAHLFRACLMFLNSPGNAENSEVVAFKDKVNNILKDFNITPADIKASFLKIYPEGEETQEAPKSAFEYKQIFQNLEKNVYIGEERPFDIGDLLREMFSDISYKISNIIQECPSINWNDTKYSELMKRFQEDLVHEVQRVLSIEALEQIKEVTNLNKYVEKKNPIFIGNEKAVVSLEIALAGKTVPNAFIKGEAGTGKTALVYELAKRINEGNVPDFLKSKIIYQIDPGAMVSGTRYRGDFEQKLQTLIEIAKDEPNLIYFIDEAHTLNGLGAGEGAADAMSLLKPAITRGELNLILATTNNEYQKFVDKDKAFARRFSPVQIIPSTKEETIEILKGILPTLSDFFGREMSEELTKKIVDLSERYAIDLANPAKAINMLELAFAEARVSKEKDLAVDIDDIINSIALRYNIIISEHKTKTTETALKSYLLGQEEPLTKICKHLGRIEAEICDPTKPVSLLLAGSTGTGKTEACKIIAKQFFGSDKALIKINMNEYGDEMSYSKLVGSAPGYVGSEEESELFSRVKEQPNSVILFDEIEKAHPKVFDALLAMLDEGEMVDNHKNHVSFKNSLVIFTTNLGYSIDDMKGKVAGFVKQTTSNSNIQKALEKEFRPEFLARLSEVIVFNSLSDEISETLIERYKNEVINRSEKIKAMNIELTKEDIEAIKKEADIKVYGARNLMRSVERKIFEKIQDLVLE